jgi:hypothetical protein
VGRLSVAFLTRSELSEQDIANRQAILAKLAQAGVSAF